MATTVDQTTPRSASLKLSGSEMLLLVLMALIQFSHIVDFMIMMPLGPQLMRLFQISPEKFGLLVSSYTFSAGVSGFLASFFIDRFDRKSCLLFFYIGFSAGTIACGLAPSYEILLGTRALTGMFGGVLGSLILSIIADAVSYDRRGTAFGILMGSSSMATVMGVPLSLQLANTFDWHAPFLALGVISAVMIPMIITFVPSLRSHLLHARKHSPWASIRHILNTPNQQLALFFMFCLILGQFSIVPFLSPSFVANAGLEESKLPLIYLFGGICTMTISPLAGRLADRFGKHVIFVIAAVLSLIPILLITNLRPHPVWVLLMISSSFFVIMSGRMVPAMAMISSTATPEYRGSFMSITSSVQQFSSGIASLLAGQIVVSDGLGHLLNYQRVGLIACAFSLISLLIATRLRAGLDQSPH